MSTKIFNPNPVIVISPVKPISRKADSLVHNLWIGGASEVEDDAENLEEIDPDEIFDLIRYIYDPEHPNTLEELRVVSAPQIIVSQNRITVEFTPTVPHCGMSTLIGLCIRVRLIQSLPNRFKVNIFLKPGSHQSEHAGLVNKQLNDKERVAAALENSILLDTVKQCLSNARGGDN